MNKNKKGENALGGILILFLGIIVVLALVPSIFQNQGTMTDDVNFTGQQTVAAASTIYWMTGQELLNIPLAINASGTFNCANNVSFAEGINPTTGLKQIKMTTDAKWVSTNCDLMNISYLYGQEGYIDDTGGRTVAGLIGLLALIALVAFCIYMWYQNSGGLFK